MQCFTAPLSIFSGKFLPTSTVPGIVLLWLCSFCRIWKAMAASAAGAEQGVLTHSKWVYHSCLISVQLIAAPKLRGLQCSKCFPFVLIISALNFSRGNCIILRNVALNFTSPSSPCDQLCGAHCAHITQQTAQGWGRDPDTPGEMDAYCTDGDSSSVGALYPELWP